MNQDGLVNHELVSALADGQLRGEQFAGVLASLVESREALSTWHAYHVVGDALRCADLADGRADLAFVARLRSRLPSSVDAPQSAAVLATEAVVLAAGIPSVVVAAGPNGRRSESANDPVTRWKLLAGMASMVAVAAVGWQLSSGNAASGSAAQLASVPGATIAATASVPATQAGMAEPPVMLRDARLDELLAAHKQFGGTSALQMPAGFLRNATFENTGR